MFLPYTVNEIKEIFMIQSVFIESQILHSSIEVQQNLKIVKQSIDWTKNQSFAVRDQGRCGGCYAFSAVLMVEHRYFLKTATKINLSVQ